MGRRLAWPVVVACLACTPAIGADTGLATGPADLSKLSIEELANVRVTTVSRKEESLADAPASVYVITREEILRSGAQTLPEILRLAPNLFVARQSASDWVVAARGLNGDSAAQNFSNKLLVLIDGRSVYTPLFSGVYWDLQDVLPEDIDHIEVISGPAGALWGANAVNGVINVITRKASDTQGGLVSVGGGDQEQAVGLRYGGKLGSAASWRIYAHGYRADDTVTATGAEARDRWARVQGGFRLDWAPGDRDALSLHGDLFSGSGLTSGNTSGGNLVARWNRTWADGSNLQVQAYYDLELRGHDLTGGLPSRVDTFDVDVQDAFTRGPHELVVGGGLRSSKYSFENLSNFVFVPESGTLDLGNVFAQDTIRLTRALHLIVGVKAEDDPYSGWSALPDARLSWTPTGAVTAWVAASRSIRSPTPFDTDVIERIGNRVFLNGNPNFQPETVMAYEAGVRLRPSARASASIAAYHNEYGDLRSIEITPVTLLPLTWGNNIQGHADGLEAWGNYQIAEWWRLFGSVNLLSESLHFKPGASGLVGVAQAGDDPKRQAKLRSSMELGHGVTLDAELRYQSALPDPFVPAYTDLNTRIAWAITERVELSVSGFNLLHKSHLEYVAPQSNAAPRSVFGEVRWRF